MCAYRVKESDEKKLDDVPEIEEGNVVYIPFAASIARDRLLIRRMTSEWLENNKNIEEIVFKDSAKDKFIHIRLGEENGKEQSESTSTTDVLSESLSNV
jgi:hypothetical protein